MTRGPLTDSASTKSEENKDSPKPEMTIRPHDWLSLMIARQATQLSNHCFSLEDGAKEVIVRDRRMGFAPAPPRHRNQ
ncbi:MAG: hypothetical protein BWY17_02179 [Deltaproteobacteria bacterium ADurb.Bin207]|jgi:hypothetical protein|nr:MAG: hypothetical protein BWY17_02179 [Deltaproteobacteria bacterium ADurb.Bin207]